jgi:hypothetical protein
MGKMVGILSNLEARRRVRYERRKSATQKAAAVKAEHEETLRQKMEDPRAKPPERLTKKEMLLLAENYRKKRKLVPRMR